MTKISTAMLAAVLTSFVAAPCHALDAPVPYSGIIDAIRKARGNAQLVTKQLVGKDVQLHIQTSGGSFFFVRAADQVFFTCDRQAPGFKGGMITAKITGYYVSEGDSDPVLKLDRCDGAGPTDGMAPQPRSGAPSSLNSTAGKSANANIPSSSSNTGPAVRKTYSAGNKQWRGSINVDSDGKTAKVLISTGSAGGSCEAKGIARFVSPTEAMFTDINEPTCKVTLAFTNRSSVRVVSDGCENMVCGAMAPGIDHIYK